MITAKAVQLLIGLIHLKGTTMKTNVTHQCSHQDSHRHSSQLCCDMLLRVDTGLSCTRPSPRHNGDPRSHWDSDSRTCNIQTGHVFTVIKSTYSLSYILKQI